jgi:hypothetical protein
MTAAASLASALMLFSLVGLRFSRGAVWAAIGLLPLLVLASASRLELALTIAVETPIGWALARPLGLERGRTALVCGLANVVTQPLLYLVLTRAPITGLLQWRTSFAVCELGVWLAEALLYLACLENLRRAAHAPAKAFGLSLAANATSALLGLVLPI